MDLTADILTNLVIEEVCTAITIYNAENTKGKQNNRQRWAIIIKYEGETQYNSNGKKYISNINNVVILPKGSCYEWTCTGSGHYSVIEFECDTRCSEIFSFNLRDGEKIHKIFRKIESNRAIDNPLSKMESVRDCYSVILTILQEKQKKYLPTSKYKKLEPALNYIAENYTLGITNDELAKCTGFSTVYFRKLFAEVFGISAVAYVHKLRISKAKEMLKSEYGSISDIAFSLGYTSIYDFSRTFKKYTGVPPSKYK